MLDTKRQRGWVIVGVVVGLLVIGGVIAAFSARSADRAFDRFSVRAQSAFDGTDASDLEARAASGSNDADDVTGGPETVAYFSQAGDLSDVSLFPPIAHYRLDTGWGRSETATICWDDDGFTIVRGRSDCDA